jgi:broad specificity phosphatase PhoE
MHFPTKHLTLLVLAVGLFPFAAGAEEVVFVVRHAEKVAGGGKDPDLSAAGRARARRLRDMLRDARIATIFVTEFKRTQQTGAPLAQQLQLDPNVVPAGNSAGLLDKVRASTGNVLIVGHSNTVPELIAGLGVAPSGQAPIQIAESDYGNLFVLVREPTPRLMRLHYR